MPISRRKLLHSWSSLLLLLPAFLGVCGPLPAQAQPHKKPRVDAYGDPLPPHALFRLGTIRLRHSASVSAVAFSADGKELLSASNSEEMHRWDMATGKERFYRRGGPLNLSPQPPLFSVDGKICAFAHPSGAKVFDGSAFKQLHANSAVPVKAAISGDGKYLLMVQDQKHLRLWNIGSGNSRQIPLKRDMDLTSFRLALSANAKILAFADSLGICLIRDKNGANVQQWRFKEKRKGVSHLRFSPDAKLLAVACFGSKAMQFWDTAAGKEKLTLELPDSFVASLAYTRDGQHVAVGDHKGNIWLWQLPAGKRVRQFSGHVGRVTSLAFSPDGALLVSGGIDRTVRLWDVKTGKQRFPARGHSGGTMHIRQSADGRYVISQSSAFSLGDELGFPVDPADTAALEFFKDPAVCIWELASGKRIRKETWNPDKVYLPHDLMQKDFLALAHTDGTVEFRDLSAGKIQRFRYAGKALFPMAVSADGRFLAIPTARAGKGMNLNAFFINGKPRQVTIHIRDIKTGREISKFSIANYCFGAFSPDGQTLLAISSEGGAASAATLQLQKQTLHFHDVRTGKKKGSFDATMDYLAVLDLLGLSHVNGFSPDSKRFRTTTNVGDHTYKIVWDVEQGHILTRYECYGGILPWQKKLARNSGDTSMFSMLDNMLPILSRGRGLVAYSSITGRIGFEGKPHLYLQEELTGDIIHSWPETFANSSLVYRLSYDGRTLASARANGQIVLFEVLSGKQLGKLKGYRGRVNQLEFASKGDRLISVGEDTTALIWDIRPFLKKRPAPRIELTRKKLDSLWQQLRNKDAKKGYQAIALLVADAKRTVPFLAAKLKPVRKVDAAAVQKAIADLDSRKFSVREKAMKKLLDLGDTVEPALWRAAANNPTLEAHLRIEKLLEHIEKKRLTPQRLQQTRALQALTWIANTESQKLLQRLASGYADAWLTRQAQYSLELSHRK